LLAAKERLPEFLRLSPDRKIPVIVEGDQVTIGFAGA
jgi:glutathione S-transferase